MTKVISACFGHKFYGGVQRLGKQIENLNSGYLYGAVTRNILLRDKKLSFLNSFFVKNQHLENSAKGFYWYVWKPWVLLRAICELDENEVLVYLDAGTEISFRGGKNFEALILNAKENGSIFFRCPQTIEEYTKPSTITYFETKNYKNNLNQVAAGILFLRNDADTRKLLRKWCRLSLHNNGILFNDEGHKKHRHDQSVLSLIIQDFNFQIVDYPIWFNNMLYFNRGIYNFPIHTFRNASNVSLLNIYYAFLFLPNRLLNASSFLNDFFVFSVKVMFKILKIKSTKIIWNENWNLILENISLSDTKNYNHRTIGDIRQKIYPDLQYFRIKYDIKKILIDKRGLYIDLENKIYYSNQVQQFGTFYGKFKIPKAREYNIEKCLPLLSLHDYNVFHFIYDLLYKALYLKNLNKKFICIISDNSKWKTDLLQIFNLEYKVLKSKSIEIAEAYVVTSPLYSGDPSIEVVNLLEGASNCILHQNNSPKKILLFRQKAKSRAVIEDEDFFKNLKNNGFTTVELEDFSIEDQIHFFKNAEIIIAAHGAGLSWIFNCPKSCLIIELFSQTYQNFVYSNIANKLKIQYHYIIGEDDYSRNIIDPDIKLTSLNKKKIFKYLLNHCKSSAKSGLN